MSSAAEGGTRRDWVPGRKHALILSFIVLVGLVRGGYWALTTEVWNPIDEAQHYAYIESLARGHGMPVVGEDKVSLDVLGVAKASPTLPFRSQLYIVSKDFDWGVFGNSYEGGGVQGPVYYGLLTPVYWMSHPFGNVAAIFALRIASVMVSLASVPLLWLLAKRLFPREPLIWVAAPAFLVLIQGFNANVASINNDALVIPVSIAALIPAVDAIRGLRTSQAVWGGVLLGLALLTKPTTTPIAVFVGLVLLWLLIRRESNIKEIVKWGLIYSACAVAVLLPYIAWNYAEYSAYSASKQVNDITGPLQGYLPFNLDSLRVHLHNARTGFWDLQPRSLGTRTDYVRLLQWSAAGAVGVGLIAAAVRRDLDLAARLAWIALAFPVAFGMKVATNYVFVEGSGSVFGRHLYTALGLMAIAVPAGLVTAFGRRAGLVALAALCALAMITERELTLHYVDNTYTSVGLDPRLAPVVDQPVYEAHGRIREVTFQAPCPAEQIALVYYNTPPKTLSVSSPAPMVATYLGHFETTFAIYALPQKVTGKLTAVANDDIAFSESNDVPEITAPGAKGDPTARLFCEVSDPKEFRFAQEYNQGHPDISYSALRLWPNAWYWAGWALLAGSILAGVAMLVEAWRKLGGIAAHDD